MGNAEFAANFVVAALIANRVVRTLIGPIGKPKIMMIPRNADNRPIENPIAARPPFA